MPKKPNLDALYKKSAKSHKYKKNPAPNVTKFPKNIDKTIIEKTIKHLENLPVKKKESIITYINKLEGFPNPIKEKIIAELEKTFKPSKYKKSKYYKTPHEIIQKAYESGKLTEMAFSKNIGPFKMILDNTLYAPLTKSKVFVKKFNKDYLIHTHVFGGNRKMRAGSAFPSSNDIFNSFYSYLVLNENLSGFKKTSSNIISVVNNKKEVGRVHFHATGKTFNIFKKFLLDLRKNSEIKYMLSVLEKKVKPSKINTNLMENYFNFMLSIHPDFRKLIAEKKTLANKSKKDNLHDLKVLLNIFEDVGFKFRYKGLEGHVYNPNKFMFEKKM